MSSQSNTDPSQVFGLRGKFESLKQTKEAGETLLAAGRAQLLTNPNPDLETKLDELETQLSLYCAVEGTALALAVSLVMAAVAPSTATTSTSNSRG